MDRRCSARPRLYLTTWWPVVSVLASVGLVGVASLCGVFPHAYPPAASAAWFRALCALPAWPMALLYTAAVRLDRGALSALVHGRLVRARLASDIDAVCVEAVQAGSNELARSWRCRLRWLGMPPLDVAPVSRWVELILSLLRERPEIGIEGQAELARRLRHASSEHPSIRLRLSTVRPRELRHRRWTGMPMGTLVAAGGPAHVLAWCVAALPVWQSVVAWSSAFHVSLVLVWLVIVASVWHWRYRKQRLMVDSAGLCLVDGRGQRHQLPWGDVVAYSGPGAPPATWGTSGGSAAIHGRHTTLAFHPFPGWRACEGLLAAALAAIDTELGRRDTEGR